MTTEHPQDATYCPSCHKHFDAPRVEEPDAATLALFCPLCGYQYARWPKPEPQAR